MLNQITFTVVALIKVADNRLFQRMNPLSVPIPSVVPTHLHLEAHTAPSDPITGTGSWPQVCKALNCERVATTPVSGHLEVEVAVICGEDSLELTDVLKFPRERQAQTKVSFWRVLTRNTQANTLWWLVHEKPTTLPSHFPFRQGDSGLLQTGIHRIKAAALHRKWGSSPGWGPRIAVSGTPNNCMRMPFRPSLLVGSLLSLKAECHGLYIWHLTRCYFMDHCHPIL